jgi:hypothetical protein
MEQGSTILVTGTALVVAKSNMKLNLEKTQAESIASRTYIIYYFAYKSQDP